MTARHTPYVPVEERNERTAHQRVAAVSERISTKRTPYAVKCRQHGTVYLTQEEYTRQMSRPDALWECPHDGRVAHFDDANYEDFLDDPE